MNGLTSRVAHGKTLRFSAFLLATAILVAAPAFAGVNRWTSSGPDVNTASCLAIDPMNPAIVYAGTIDARGIFRTANLGLSWSASNAGLAGAAGAPAVIGLAIDPLTPSTVYAGTQLGIFKSVDAGASWSTVRPDLTYSLAIDLATPSTVYAGTTSGVVKSTDGGATWSDRLLAPAIYALVIDPRKPSTIYAADYEYSGFTGASSALFKSTDDSVTWSKSNINVSISPGALAIDPTQPSTLYAGASYGGVYKSVDSGSTWSLPSIDLARVGVNAVVIDPSNPSTLYAGTSGGVFRSTDGGASWTPFNSGLSNLGVQALAIDRAGKRLYAGTSGGGIFDYQIAANVPCAPGADDLCLLGNRFQVSLQASDRRTGRTAIGLAISQDDRFGYFSLPTITGDPTFPEVFVKMADATSMPAPFGGSFWVFHSGLTDLSYTMTVIDTVTLAQVKFYQNDPSNPECGGADTSAFQNIGASGLQLTGQAAATSLAAASGIELALLGNRFRVTMTAVDPRTGRTAVGQAMPQGDRFGYFSLPDFTGDPAFPEVFVKMVDATSSSGGSFWVFHTGLTDLQYTMTVTDTTTGAVKIYQNDRSNPAHLCGGADTAAFAR